MKTRSPNTKMGNGKLSFATACLSTRALSFWLANSYASSNFRQYQGYRRLETAVQKWTELREYVDVEQNGTIKHQEVDDFLDRFGAGTVLCQLTVSPHLSHVIELCIAGMLCTVL